MLLSALDHDHDLRRGGLFQGPYNKRLHILGNSVVQTLNIEIQIDTLTTRTLTSKQRVVQYFHPPPHVPSGRNTIYNGNYNTTAIKISRHFILSKPHVDT